MEQQDILRGLKQELAGVELGIEQGADQGDTELVEYLVEQQSFLNKEIKRLEEVFA